MLHGEFSEFYRLENGTVQPLIYGLLALIFMAPGMYFFVNPKSTWDISPAQSREYNDECFILNFYDFHDVWHLLSAPGLFFSFMVCLSWLFNVVRGYIIWKKFDLRNNIFVYCLRYSLQSTIEY